MKKNKIKLELCADKSGVCIWAIKNGKRAWIIDASTILEDGTFDFHAKRFKKVKEDGNCWRYKLVT